VTVTFIRVTSPLFADHPGGPPRLGDSDDPNGTAAGHCDHIISISQGTSAASESLSLSQRQSDQPECHRQSRFKFMIRPGARLKLAATARTLASQPVAVTVTVPRTVP
jgi:hypothetical protein